MNLLNFFIGEGRIYNPDLSGNYNPAVGTNSLLTKYAAFDLGAFVCYGMPTFNNNDKVAARVNPIPSPTLFAPPSDINAKIEAMVDWNADVLGADYIIFTVKHVYDFGLYPFTSNYGGGVDLENTTDADRGTVTLPQYRNYHVDSPLYGTKPSQTIIETFVNRCRVKGVEPMLYYQGAWNFNTNGADNVNDSAYDETGNYDLWYAEFLANGWEAANTAYPNITGTYAEQYQNRQDYHLYEIKELINATDCQYFWIDSSHVYPRGFLQQIYNGTKQDKDTIIIANTKPIPNGGTVYPTGSIPSDAPYTFNGDFYLHPLDVISFEDFRRPANPSEYNFETLWKGTNYYVPREIVAKTASTWYYVTPFTVSGQSTIQGYYDAAKSFGIPCSLSLGLKSDGTMDATQQSRLLGVVRI